MQVHVSKKPSATSTKWEAFFENDGVVVYESDKYFDFYKVKVKSTNKSKSFFGETAWMDTQRFAVDNSDFSAYSIFN